MVGALAQADAVHLTRPAASSLSERYVKIVRKVALPTLKCHVLNGIKVTDKYFLILAELPQSSPPQGVQGSWK